MPRTPDPNWVLHTTFASASEPGVLRKVEEHRVTGELRCNCPGWVFSDRGRNAGNPKDCPHIDRVVTDTPGYHEAWRALTASLFAAGITITRNDKNQKLPFHAAVGMGTLHLDVRPVTVRAMVLEMLRRTPHVPPAGRPVAAPTRGRLITLDT